MKARSSSPVMPSGSAAQRPPLERLRDGRAVAVAGLLVLLVLVVDDLEEEHPAQLADPLGVDAHVLPHDVLDGLDRGADGHGAQPGRV
jgi:hypothetical protein